MKHHFKISFSLILLLSLTFSSVFGIVENKAVSFRRETLDTPTKLHVQHHSQTPSYHETCVEKDLVLENEEEDSREEVFAETTPEFTRSFILSPYQSDNSVRLAPDLPISLNILYCVFRI